MSPQITPQQLSALRQICLAVIDAVRECPAGAPAGALYAALVSQGCRESQFSSLMSGLCKNGYLRQEGLLYFVGPKAPRTTETANTQAA